jgi:tRNA pseudouridine55 synthase
VQQVESVIPSFVGDIMQIPMVSAVHHEGKRLYELARKNVVVERKPRAVTVYSIRMLGFVSGEHPRVELVITCGKGTYVRTLCADIGRALGCGGHMGSLVRSRVGNFSLENAVTLEDLESLVNQGKGEEILVPMDKALSKMPFVKLNERDSLLIRHGVMVPTSVKIDVDIIIRIHDSEGELIALGRIVEQEEGVKLRPEKVFSLEKDIAD